MNAESIGYLRELLVNTESPAGAIVNLTILLLFLAGLVDAIAALVRLRREEANLRLARARLAAVAAASASGIDVATALEVPRAGLVGRRIERVLQLRGAGLRHPAMLRELTGDRLAGYGALARYIGAILTLLGLLGTVLGLSFALFNIQGALGRVDDLQAFRELTHALGQTLLGMRTAFACTMAGLATALLLSFFNHAVGRSQARFAADLEELVSCELLPVLERLDPGADEAARTFARLLAEAGRDVERWREQVTAAAAQYGEASQRMAASGQALSTSVGELSAGQRLVADTVRGTGEALRELVQLGGSARTFLAELTEHHERALVDQLRAGHQLYESSLDRHMQELQALVAGSRETMTDLARAQSTALAAYSDLVCDVRTHLATAGPADIAQTLSATLEASQAAFQELRGLAARFEPAVLESHRQSRAATEAALAEVRTAVSQLLADLAQQQREGTDLQVQSLEAALESALARHAEAFHRLLEQSREGIAPLLDAHGSTLRVFSDLVIDMRGQIGPLFEQLSHAGNGRPGQPALPGKS